MKNTDIDLSEEQVASFSADGFIRLEEAFSENLAARCRDHLWQALNRMAGISPDEPHSWQEPVIRIPLMTLPAFAEAANTPKLTGAYDALTGKGQWQKLMGLGSFPVRFPSSRPPADTGWHVDMSFGTDHPDFMEWRINSASRGRLLLMLFLFSNVGSDDAPTRIRKGSHRTIARELLPHGSEGLTLRELAADGFASTAGCEEMLATGPAGTVYLCHPFIVHSSQGHRGTAPRFMAQPPLLPKDGFDSP
ncbi:hypothetical protein [Aquisalinus luteolus]|uniref:Phytanoyl-CoA dioxygenase n=1 Tax=Aquisalinus luteolus TaxID=1566827 RepID=A0A8J3ERE8_9PROT|nr:hypothetical protein [Aquisalinus luteolus]GGH98465.1 phytanoyl-CoA dioxygenase [Aquisalinus luteolus]